MILLIIRMIFLGMAKMMSKIDLPVSTKFLDSTPSPVNAASSLFDALGLRSLTVGDSKSETSEASSLATEIIVELLVGKQTNVIGRS